jgi:hypothetical protein
VPDLAVGHEIVGTNDVALIDVGPVDELVDLDGSRRVDLDFLKLFRLDGNVGVGIDLVAFDDIVGFDFVPRVSVYFQVPDAMARSSG